MQDSLSKENETTNKGGFVSKIRGRRRGKDKYLFPSIPIPRIRGAIRYWMENNEFGKVNKWLGESRNKLEGMFKAGEVPVVGWLELAGTLNNAGPCKRNLEAKMNENAREREEVAAQIRILQAKQQELEEQNKDLQHKMKGMEQIALLKAESQSIAMLANKEAACVAKVGEKMKNEYFMEDFDAEDVSTVFSMFKMDALFSRFRKNESDNNLEITRVTPVVDLQKSMGFDFPESMELLWKLNLLEKGEKEAESQQSAAFAALAS